ncbi:Ig-like domain-containing protein [Bifidobacterium sp. ESL0732]|uniref:Ig-like domain-containing protein n=1 Tax=Bifidobacterium sp. ESL0732 TaxID=2983222 RepID=UPI0023F86E38|nr:Ig-like domain-containing protein [Bifidobacterium sp. ESL0732]WEV63729.1 Ig-like domain-containing protein [Bifidobacterium sp. ESL0732]
MKLHQLCAVFAASAMLLSVTLCAASSAQADEVSAGSQLQTDSQVSVNLNDSTGAIKYGATGFLYGLADDGTPSDTMLDGLTHLDSMVGRPLNGLQHPNGDVMATAPQWKRNGGGDIQVYLKDSYPIPWPYPVYSPNIQTDYLPKIRQQVNAVNASPYKDSYVYVPLNEPDCGDANYKNGVCGIDTVASLSNLSWTKMLDDWKTMFNYIRSLEPGARIAGPNFSWYESNHYRSFLQYAKDNNVVPDIVTWHELSGPENFYGHYDDWKGIVNDVLGANANIPVSINEYAKSSGELNKPGSLIQYISRFENYKVSADLPYWFPTGDLDWLTTHNNQATGTWWLYNWYGGLTGHTVKVDLPDREQATQAVAAYDEATKQTRVIFGGYTDESAPFSTKLKFDNASGKYPNGARVTVYGVDATEAGNANDKVPGASDGPYLVNQHSYSASRLAAGIDLTGLNAASAYYAIVSPDTAQNDAVNGRYEAEYARVDGAASVGYGNVPGYGATGYVQGFDNTNSGSTFFVTSKKNGYANLKISYSSGAPTSSTGERTLHMKINKGEPLTLTLPKTTHSKKWNTVTVRAYLPLGINQIDLLAASNGSAQGLLLDSLDVSESGDVAKTYQAESGDNTRSGSARIESSPAAQSGRIVTYVGAGAGNTLQFNKVNVAQAGDYTLTFGYAQHDFAGGNAFQTTNRWADITVNGDSASAQHVVFANTRDWNNFWTTSIRVNLHAGDNTVLLGNSTGFAPNMDYMMVGRTSVQLVSEPLPPDAEAVTISGKGVAEGKLELHKGDNAKLVAAVTPANAGDKSVTWSSSDDAIATVDADGTVHALGVGKALIRAASASNSEVSSAVEVTVKSEESHEGVIDGDQNNHNEQLDSNQYQKPKDSLSQTGSDVFVPMCVAFIVFATALVLTLIVGRKKEK